MTTTQNLIDEAPLIVQRMLAMGMCSKPRDTGDLEWRRFSSAKSLERHRKRNKKGNR